MRYRITFEAYDNIPEEVLTAESPREMGHDFRRVIKRRGFSPFLIEAFDHESGELAWDMEWNDPDLWLEAEDFAYFTSVGAEEQLVLLIFINGNLYSNKETS